MKTKSILTALCLPLAFTACTNDEFLSEGAPLESRGKIDVVLNAARPELGVDTRMTATGDDVNGYSFVWERNTDMLGAALVDGSGAVGNDVLVNYPFVADQTGATSTFSSKSSITQGKYVFYYAYQDVLDRKGLAISSAKQVYDAASTKSSAEQAATYMKQVSPIIDLANGVTYEKAQSYNLDLEFAQLYTLVHVDIVSKNIPSGVTPKVTKVTIDKLNNTVAGGGTSQYKLDAALDFATFGSAVGLDRYGVVIASQLATAKTALQTAVYNGTVYDANKADGSTPATQGAYALEVNGDVELKEGETTKLYMVVPQGLTQYLVVKVYTTEGVYTRELNISNASARVFGNTVKGLNAELNFAQDGSGNVILPSTFDIATKDDWDNAIEFMTSHAIGYLNKTASFKLTDDVTIGSLPVFNLAVTGATSNETLTLGKDFTFTSDNANQFTFTGVKLGVAEGATLTINYQPTNITTDIINNGTLNVGANLRNKITNLGTMNVTASVTLAGALTNGQKYIPSTQPEIAGTININANKGLAIGVASSNLVGTINVANGAALTTSTAALTNDGTIVNRGTLQGTAALVNTGTIDNFGVLANSVTNTDGEFIIESGSMTDNTLTTETITDGSVEVKNVTTFSALQTDANFPNRKYAFSSAVVTTLVNNAGEYQQADAASVGITDITLNGGDWTLSSSYGSDASKQIEVPAQAAITGITLNGANLTLATNLSENLTVKGTSSVTGTGTITGNLTVAAGANFTVGSNITMNSLSGNTATANLSGNVTLNPNAKMYFKTASVNIGATLTVKGNSNSIAGAAEFGVQTTFTNAGTVVAEESTATTGAKVQGKVTQPTNTGTGVFRGNAETGFSWT